MKHLLPLLIFLYSCGASVKEEPGPPRVNLYKETRIEIFKTAHIDSTSTVIIGTSISEAIPPFMLDKPTFNFAVGGGVCSDFKELIPFVASNHPKAVLIELGINDLKNDIHNLPTASKKLVDSVSSIVSYFKEHSPTTRLYILSVLPVNKTYFKSYSQEINSTIKEVNQKFQSLDAAFINAYPLFLTNSVLSDSLTYDGLHLNLKGYQLLNSLILDTNL